MQHVFFLEYSQSYFAMIIEALKEIILIQTNLFLFALSFQSQIYQAKSQRLQFQNRTVVIECQKMLAESIKAKQNHLINTNCSFDMEDSDRQEVKTCIGKGKKRVGRYSFYLKNMIGSGYSSKVYKGIKDNNKHQWYAIKVIKLKEMNVANIYLLNNEIDIIQKLDHQNIVKFVDVQYTNNHCYLITQYCEGGNLQRYTKVYESVEWGSIVYQISQGCQYLANNNIVHRDLKPANIFLKDGKWKIGDFGFSKRIPNLSSLIIENYKVGSPLFMPIETLQRNMYSAKSDSFALGIIIYYLIFKQYPWHGSTLNKLIKNYNDKDIDWTRFDLFPIQIAAIVKGLCNMNMKERLQLCNCNFEIFLTQKSIKEINESMVVHIKAKVTEQVILCQFINYLIQNSMLFLDDDHMLYSLMSNNLYHLTEIFKWDENKCLKDMKSEYILPSGNVRITEENYRKILLYLQQIINLLKFRSDSHFHQVALQKLLEYYCICKLILHAEIQQLSVFLKSIVLHKNFHDLLPNLGRIQTLMEITFKNQ